MNKIPLGEFRAPTLEEERAIFVPRIKQFRQDVDALIQRVSKLPPDQECSGGKIMPNAFSTQEPVAQVRIHLTDAKMWAGKILEALGNPFPAELADRAGR